MFWCLRAFLAYTLCGCCDFRSVKMSLNGKSVGDDITSQPGENVGNDIILEGELEGAETLLTHGISKLVAKQLMDIYKTGKLAQSDLDDRALEALREFSAQDAIQVLHQFCDADLEHVGNKSAYLCGLLKIFRHQSKAGHPSSAIKGPNEAKLKEILERTGYSLDVTTGQRKYGGPPPGGDPTPPGPGHEVFCGKIPKDVFEDELIPLFEQFGQIWDMRLMMDPLTGFNRGYAFITYSDKDSAAKAVDKLQNYEVRPGRQLKVNISVANVRLFVGNIPKNKSKQDIKQEFGKRTDGLLDVIVYNLADNPRQKNRGFAFLEYESHKHASNAKRKLQSGQPKFWQCDIIVDWADPLQEPDTATMAKVKVLYIRNLTSDVTDVVLKEKFGKFGTIERVKKIKDYGFVHFQDRADALKAMEALNGQKIGGLLVDISLAKPPSDNKKKELRKREQDRQVIGAGEHYGYDDYWSPPVARYPPLVRSLPLRPPPYPEPFFDDYYGYEYDDFDYYGYPPLPPPLPLLPPVRIPARSNLPPPPGPGTRGRATTRGLNTRVPRGRNPSVAARAGKRKAAADFETSNGKRQNADSWGTQPIAQQPLRQDLTDDRYDAFRYDGREDVWYEDSYGHIWG